MNMRRKKILTTLDTCMMTLVDAFFIPGFFYRITSGFVHYNGYNIRPVAWPRGFGGNCPPTFAKMVLEISLKSIRK